MPLIPAALVLKGGMIDPYISLLGLIKITVNNRRGPFLHPLFYYGFNSYPASAFSLGGPSIGPLAFCFCALLSGRMAICTGWNNEIPPFRGAKY